MESPCRPRSTSVTFVRSRTSSRPDDIPEFKSDDEDIQITLAAPYIQTYLAYSSRGLTCCGLSLPIPFERASRSSWWDPRFDSDILEGQYKRSAFTHLRLRFRYALFYILLISISWLTYFLYTGLTNNDPTKWPIQCIILTLLIITDLSVLYFTHTELYRLHITAPSIFIACLLCFVNLISVYLTRMTTMTQFGVCIELILLIYTVIPLPLYICVCVSTIYSMIFESLTYYSTEDYTLLGRILMHVCVHLIGVHIYIMTNVRMRGTFMKVGQSLLVRRQLEMEKQLKEKMIHSVMPPRVADWLMSEDFDNTNIMRNDLKSLFRPFNMNRMENVSILFADIVGFTKMSSNKTAEELVQILNDLFERFDDLCVLNNCEKISTLGDCYYCVSGCPEPRIDHAKCCVEMGLQMIDAIKQFDVERNEGVNMRVGIHTGTVLCGIVGTRRFKFDVWSNDVSYANLMESTGKPGSVHISERTLEYLQNLYVFEDGEMVNGLKTFYIMGRTGEINCNGVPLIISPAISPKSISPQPRPRFLSASNQNPNQLSPNIFRMKASSLPSILDSETEIDKEDPIVEIQSKSPSNKYKIKNWRVPKFFKNEELTTVKIEPPPPNGYQQVPTIVETQKNGTDILDIKSYISQSRSDIGHFDRSPTDFLRTGSFKSNLSPRDDRVCKNFRSPRNSDVISPIERERSATVVCRMDTGGCLEVPGLLHAEDQLSVCMSVNSRKDSGIKSTSRRSSIQQQIFALNQAAVSHADIFQHRVSGYYTSSQSTINSLHQTSQGKPQFSDHLGACVQKLRKQSDLQLIRCVQDNTSSKRSYFLKPPLSHFTLFFKSHEMECEYRKNVYTISEKFNDITLPTLATARYNTYFDVTVSFLIFVIVGLMSGYYGMEWWKWIPMGIGAIAELIVMYFCFKQMMLRYTEQHLVYKLFSQWYSWHLIGGLFVSIPVFLVLIQFLNLPLLIGLIHFCNFTQLNCWMKNILAFLSILIYLSFQTSHTTELILNLILFLILIGFLNREFEISYRLSFHSNVIANRDKVRVQNMKNQADWLLHNIIPKHVADQLKQSAKYSENHKNVGIIFASIVNFNEMYDESYMGGKEFLRVLNELIGDFDQLLTKEEFKSVDKIKTIGSTFMAASGLNPQLRGNDYEHLFALMDFAIEMQKVIDEFNRDLLEFNLILRVGFNCGDVTAGVIGTTKLYYDIWGDAVNIASRMDSTGVNGRIQVGEGCVDVMSEKYEFESRGSVYVKGKDNMNVYLLVRKKNFLDIG